jgi:hypothetical protein
MTSTLRAYLPRLLVLAVLGLFGAAGIAEADSGGATSFTGRADRDVTVQRETERTTGVDSAAFPPRETRTAHAPYP